MSLFFKNKTNVDPGAWNILSMLGEPSIDLPSNQPTEVKLSPNMRYYYDEDGNGAYTGPFEAGNEMPITNGWIVIFQALSGDLGEDVFVWAEIGGVRHHATVSTRAGELNEDINTSDITVRLSEADGSVIPDANVEIRLVGAADSDTAGAVAQGTFKRKTNGDGSVTFALWPNANHPSKTVYEIRSKHPKTGKSIHTGQQFVVGNVDANIDQLIDIVN